MGNRTIVAIASVFAIMMVFSGCCGFTLPGGETQKNWGNQSDVIADIEPDQVNLSNINGSGPLIPPTDAGGQGQIIDVGGNTSGTGSGGSGSTASTQTECSTMTPTCRDCVAKSGCGWCKSSNSCFLGNANGPSVSSCANGEWATTESACAAPVGGDPCSKQTNCANCLSGSGCAWCIEGSKCASINGGGSCTSGWKDKIYMCNYASR